MFSRRHAVFSVVALLVAISFLGGCVTPGGKGFTDLFDSGESRTIKRDAASYEEEGKRWGTKHWNWNKNISLKPGEIDTAFINALIDPNNLDFFWVHAELKDAFKKGYRLGYQDRTADLVLGPHLTTAAAKIGNLTANRFVNTIETFERDWAAHLKRAIDVFITLISEGSQADREEFIKNFTTEYSAKYNKTKEALRAGGFMAQVSEGGTMLHIDASKTLAVLDIPKPETLKTEIYRQTFKVMGDEWGRRYSTSLIKRGDLVELFRKSKTALQEVSPGLSGNLNIVKEAFIKSYGTDAANVFSSLVKEAGY